MRVLSPSESAAVLAAIRAKAPRRVRRGHARLLGDLTAPQPGMNGVGYSQQDPHSFPTEGLVYDENIVFGDPNAVPLSSLPNTQGLIDLNTTVNQSQASAPAAAPGSASLSWQPYNYTIFNFVANNSLSPQQVLGANPKRQALLVQNQDAANAIYFNLGQNAGLGQGILLNAGFGLLWEIKPPSNFVTVFCPAGAALGVVAEAQ
ncbi:MAG: hypothetical protein ACRDQZ_23130 [Mycobacteriales bacterium]